MKPLIKEIEAALIDAIQDSAEFDYVPDNQVQSVSSENIDFENEEILITPPAVLVLYTGGVYDPMEVTKYRYSVDETFLLIAVAHNARGTAEAKAGGVSGEVGVYDMLDDLKTLFGGLKIAANASSNVYCRLKRTSIVAAGNGGAAYSLEIGVRSTWDNV